MNLPHHPAPSAPRTPRRLAAAVLLLACGAAAAALPDIARPIPAPHQLWTGHALAGMLVALLTFATARSLPVTGIVIGVALWYAATAFVGEPVPPQALAQFGERYAFHVHASALLIPLMALGGFGIQRTVRRADLEVLGLDWLLGPGKA
jgi:hypothetical protein